MGGLLVDTRRALLRRRGGFAYDDIPNLVHIYEPARRTLTAYAGNLVRLRRASDNAELDFGHVGNGDLDVVSIAAWAGGASYVVTIYDQIGDDDVTQAVAGDQPLFTAAAQNDHAGMTLNGTSHHLRGAYTNSGQLSQPYSVYATAEMNAGLVNDGNRHFLLAPNENANYFIMRQDQGAAPDSWSIFCGILLGTGASDANLNLWAALANGVASQFWINNVSEAAGNAGAGDARGLTIGSQPVGAGGLWGGIILNAIVCDPAHTDAQRLTMQTAINAYWAVY